MLSMSIAPGILRYSPRVDVDLRPLLFVDLVQLNLDLFSPTTRVSQKSPRFGSQLLCVRQLTLIFGLCSLTVFDSGFDNVVRLWTPLVAGRDTERGASGENQEQGSDEREADRSSSLMDIARRNQGDMDAGVLFSPSP